MKINIGGRCAGLNSAFYVFYCAYYSGFTKRPWHQLHVDYVGNDWFVHTNA